MAEGFDELIGILSDLGSVGRKVGKKALEEGAEIVLQQQKKDVPTLSRDGGSALEITKVTSNIADIGINASNWEETKHLYFLHYGYLLWKNGQTVDTHQGWMTDSFSSCKDKVAKAMISTLNKEIDKILN